MRFLLLLAVLLLPGCAWLGIGAEVTKDTLPQGSNIGAFKVGKPYKIDGQWYYPQESYTYDETGIASWYGPGFHGQSTANGERYSQRELTAAHRTLQMPSFVRVTNLDNGRSVVVRINDRGPYARGRIIDVSEKAAELLAFKAVGTARVRVQVLPEASRQLAQAAKEGRPWHGSIPDEQVMTASTYESPAAPMAGAPRPVELNGQPVPAHEVAGEFYPDPVMTPQVVPASTTLYIQAGSFSSLDNANRLVQTLSGRARAYVSDATVRGVVYHRVRLGPFKTVDEADDTLKAIGQLAPDAKTIVE